ncbi:MAG: serine hydrolase domain-containing protein [Phycisphaerales bacterium]
MNSKQVFIAFVILLSCGAGQVPAGAAPWPPDLVSPAPSQHASDLAEAIEKIRARHDQPGMAVASIRDGAVADVIVIGNRTARHDIAIERNDAFHIGSCTKALTSTLIAVLIERGDLSWHTTVVDVFPEWKGVVDPAFERITVEQLLTHQAGVMPFTQPGETEEDLITHVDGTAREQRVEFARRVLSQKPIAQPGHGFAYSNAGYAVVTAIAERVTGSDWSELTRELIFKPLRMEHSSFGLPGTRGETEPSAPWGHFPGPNGYAAIPPAMPAMLPPVLAPAGDIECSVADLAAFVAMHARGLAEESEPDDVLSAASIRKLHTAARNDYAMGWFDYQLGAYKVTAHNGSAGTFFAFIAIDRETHHAVVVLSNAGDGNQACLEAAVAVFDALND